MLACTDDRFGSVIRTRIPWVGSVGACDMVNFGGRETVPAQFAARNLYVHNAQVTLMRTTAEENAAIGRWIIERVNRMEGPVRFLLPLHGVSAIDAPGKPFHDPAADAALFAAIREAGSPRPTASSSRSTPTSMTRPSPRPRFTPSATSPEDSRMARAYASIILKAPVETVWSIVRDFNGLPKWTGGGVTSQDREGPRRRRRRLHPQLPARQWRACARAPADAGRCQALLHL